MYSVKLKKGLITSTKRIIMLFMAFAIAFSFIGGFDMFAVKTNAASKWDGWIKISSADDLKLMKGSSKNFYLAKDIDLKNIKNWQPIGDASVDSNYFKGTLDGNGYAIKNLKSTNGGLFDYIQNATIKNLGLLNVDIKVAKETSGSSGALAKRAESLYDGSEKGSLIENCYVTGKIAGNNTAGFIGIAEKTTFNNCLNRADITGIENASGICAVPSNSSYYNCMNQGSIKGENVSGVTHSLYPSNSVSAATLVACFNTGNVTCTGTKKAGELVYYGHLTPDERSKATIKDCGYIGENAAAFVFDFEDEELFIFGSKKMTKSALKKQETYKEWDFKNTWYMDSKINNGYPILQSMLKNYNASKPVADKDSGEYAKGTEIKLSIELKDVTIYYTTDGKTPTTSSKKYTGAITISSDTTVKTVAFTNSGKTRGKVASFNYKVKK